MSLEAVALVPFEPKLIDFDMMSREQLQVPPK